MLIGRYEQGNCKGSSVSVPRLDGVASDRLSQLLSDIQGAQDANRQARLVNADTQVDNLQVLELIVEARQELRDHLTSGNDYGGRLKDVIYLDLALETQARYDC